MRSTGSRPSCATCPGPPRSSTSRPAPQRRRRKRGRLADPDTRVFINEAVCEGCGDCSVQSGCMSILPKPTPLGVKRQIDQSACNKDYTCLKGFCPAMVTVEGGSLRASPRRRRSRRNGSRTCQRRRGGG
ncbi:MAG: hypothetical protein R3D80_06670 [Paracoccaceae bacterium]